MIREELEGSAPAFQRETSLHYGLSLGTVVHCWNQRGSNKRQMAPLKRYKNVDFDCSLIL